MPGKNGIELAGTLKRLSPETGIIIVTAYGEYALDAFRLFVSGYILKPVKDADVRAALNHLRHAASQPEIKLTARCFGHFDVFYEGKPVRFQRKRSKELLAYLISLRGSSASREKICDNLFEDAGSIDKWIPTFKIIVHSLRKTLEKLGCGNLLIHSQNRYSVDTSVIQCDYFDYVCGRPPEPPATGYQGEFMSQYSWAEQYYYTLEMIRGEVNEK